MVTWKWRNVQIDCYNKFIFRTGSKSDKENINFVLNKIGTP